MTMRAGHLARGLALALPLLSCSVQAQRNLEFLFPVVDTLTLGEHPFQVEPGLTFKLLGDQALPLPTQRLTFEREGSHGKVVLVFRTDKHLSLGFTGYWSAGVVTFNGTAPHWDTLAHRDGKLYFRDEEVRNVLVRRTAPVP